MNTTITLNKFKRPDDQQEFNKKLLSVIPHLHPYVKHRLYIAESIGILPRNMYCSNGIIDDSIVKLYQEHFDIDMDRLTLELTLFKISDQLIDELYEKEGWHQQSVSTQDFLNVELEKLQEIFTIQANQELIMNEDLDDICYRQKLQSKTFFVYDNMDSEILKIIDPEPANSYRKQKLLGKFYSWLPLETSKIIDLFVFGKLNFDEIAFVMELHPKSVKETIVDVRKSFRQNLI